MMFLSRSGDISSLNSNPDQKKEKLLNKSEKWHKIREIHQKDDYMAVRKMLVACVIMAISSSAMASEKVENIKGVLGKEVSFSVESNPTTGYGWMIKSLPDELIFISSSYEQPKDCGEGAVGCSGKETFNFIAQKSGKGELKLIYGQPFDKASWKESIVNVDVN